MNQPLERPITSILNKHNLRPDKNLGQNFLTDPNILNKITSIAAISAENSVLEIGAGLGHLTAHLARSASHVTAVEIDPRLIPVLEENLANYPNIKLVQGDILNLDPRELVQENGYLVVANIPYYITSRIIRHLLESDLKPARIILTIQYEVAQRICARDGKLSLLALSVLVYGEPHLELRIPAGAFYPKPEVDSAVIKINLYQQPLLEAGLRAGFFKIVKAGFRHKRKTLRNSISKGLRWEAAKVEDLLATQGIDPGLRAENISIDQWLDLARAYDKIQSSD
jgi:16S rRNA (adenine1518-N6/adenine1519-N6)-dimethyltransferase